MRLGDSEVLEQAAAHVWRGKGSADEKKLRTLGTLRTFRVEKAPNRCIPAPPGSSKWKSHLLGPGNRQCPAMEANLPPSVGTRVGGYRPRRVVGGSSGDQQVHEGEEAWDVTLAAS